MFYTSFLPVEAIVPPGISRRQFSDLIMHALGAFPGDGGNGAFAETYLAGYSFADLPLIVLSDKESEAESGSSLFICISTGKWMQDRTTWTTRRLDELPWAINWAISQLKSGPLTEEAATIIRDNANLGELAQGAAREFPPVSLVFARESPEAILDKTLAPLAGNLMVSATHWGQNLVFYIKKSALPGGAPPELRQLGYREVAALAHKFFQLQAQYARISSQTVPLPNLQARFETELLAKNREAQRILQAERIAPSSGFQRPSGKFRPISGMTRQEQAALERLRLKSRARAIRH